MTVRTWYKEDTTYSAAGLIGLFTNNRSFELDDLAGDPAVKPVQLTLDFKETEGNHHQ